MADTFLNSILQNFEPCERVPFVHIQLRHHDFDVIGGGDTVCGCNGSGYDCNCDSMAPDCDDD